MGFGFGGGCDFNRCDDRRDHHQKDENNRQVNNNPELLQFLRTLTPG
ncbi:TPA: hypothetical protein QCZ17_005030, partial [Bacillus cereus]|nr:hypothetical protein [Bacillus cereus]